MKVKTVSSRQVWQSPDKQRTIWEINIRDETGKTWPLKTYSQEIAEVGFGGEVETYDGKDGQKFVKQPNAQGGYKGGGNNAARLEADKLKQKEIRAEWAIGKAITSLGIFPLDGEALDKVRDLASKLYDMVDGVITSHAERDEQ